MSERLQKALARAGYGSRRMLETAITEGRVSVNGAIAVLGTKVEKDDKVNFDGKPVPAEKLFEQARLVIAYHKPEGEVCTRNDRSEEPQTRRVSGVVIIFQMRMGKVLDFG